MQIKRIYFTYASMVCLASLLAWMVAYYLNLDKPYWSIMTVSIVAYLSQNALMAKFLARTGGTLIGAIAVNLIACAGLSDPWLMSIYLASWLAFCTFMATCYTGMLSYFYALSGYTSAIIGFSLGLSPEPYSVFFITQARVSEIALGLACSALVALLCRRDYDHSTLEHSIKADGTALYEIFKDLLATTLKPDDLVKRVKAVLVQMYQTRALSTRYDNLSLTGKGLKPGHANLAILADIVPLSSMKWRIVGEQAGDSGFSSYLQRLQQWIDTRLNDQRNTEPAPVLPLTCETPHAVYFANRIQRLMALALYSKNAQNPASTFNNLQYRDYTQAFLSAVRTFIFVLLGASLWIVAQWDYGYILPIVVGIACTLAGAYPSVNKVIPLVVVAALLAVPVAYVLVFCVFISSDEIVLCILAFMPVLFATSLIKAVSPLGFAFGGIFINVVITLVGFNNPMKYDYSYFVNFVCAQFLSVGMVSLAFNILPVSGQKQQFDRMVQALLCRAKAVTREPGDRPRSEFNVYGFSIMERANTYVSPELSLRVSRIVLLSISVVDYVTSKCSSREQAIFDELFDKLQKEDYVACFKLIDTLETFEGDTASLELWTLRSTFKFMAE